MTPIPASPASRKKRPRTGAASSGAGRNESKYGTSRALERNVALGSMMGTTGQTAKSKSTTINTATTKTQRSVVADALEANRQLQKRVLSNLQETSRRMRENRIRADACLNELLPWELVGQSDSYRAAATVGDIPTADELKALFASESGNSNSNGNDNTKNKNHHDDTNRKTFNFNQRRHRQPFRYDPKRKWTLEYFVDPTGSRPHENPDVVKRRRYRDSQLLSSSLLSSSSSGHGDGDGHHGDGRGEGKEVNEDIAAPPHGTNANSTSKKEGGDDGPTTRARIYAPAGVFFHHSSPPYSNQERARLEQLLSSSVGRRSRDDFEGDDVVVRGAAHLDGPQIRSYQDVARILRDEATISNKRSRGSITLPRTAKDIQLYHQHLTASNYTFSEQQSSRLFDLVQQQLQQKHASLGTPVANHGVKRVGIEDVDSGVEDVAVAEDRNSNHRETPSGINNDGMGPDWKAISETLLHDYYRTIKHPDVGTGTSREQDDGDDDNKNQHNNDPLFLPIAPPPPITPYQCMVHYKTTLLPKMLMLAGMDDSLPGANAPTGFTRDEDELLLRYLAAMGPQFVWDMEQISHLAVRLFPGRTARQLYERTTFSLWNPLAGVAGSGHSVEGGTGDDDKNRDTTGLYWTRSEEQKLVLAMKIYGGGGDGGDEENDVDDGDDADESNGRRNDDRNNTDKGGAAPVSAIRKAAAHFFPQRPFDRVARKWERSLDPKLSNRPFTRQEDNKLLNAVRTSAPSQTFGDIAREHFPNRSRAQIYQRWIEMTTAQNVDDE